MSLYSNQSTDGRIRRLLSDTVENLSERIFPNISSRHFHEPSATKFSSEVVSSLPFQMNLYFSALFFPFWFISSVVMLHMKFAYISSLYQFILVAIHASVPVIEIIRLYIGHIGNFESKVPELAGSWLLTLLLQLPLLLFLLIVPGTKLLPLDYAVSSIFLVFVAFHLLTGYKAINITAAHQARLYHIYTLIGDGTVEEE
ncbi:transmembrane protein 17-like [Oratosquilla oratoria]|uniref:transmembrane protein 17-like n=1 Tax=Oratosquilla oratoria TaxID=337810 RepID=UPI003F75D5B7